MKLDYNNLTFTEFQEYVKTRSYNPETKEKRYMKFIEEIGELSEVIRKEKYMVDGNIKDSIEEELYDCLYSIFSVADGYGIDIKTCVELKDKYNRERFGE